MLQKRCLNCKYRRPILHQDPFVGGCVKKQTRVLPTDLCDDYFPCIEFMLEVCKDGSDEDYAELMLLVNSKDKLTKEERARRMNEMLDKIIDDLEEDEIDRMKERIEL